MGRLAWKVIWGSALYYPKKATYTYDLQGNLTQRGFIDQDWRTYPFYWNYSYDTAGRLSNVQTNADGSVTQEAAYQYFASGKPNQMTLGPSPVAAVAYRYNQRDWLTSISTADFWEHLGYNLSQEIGGTAQFNGNISWTSYYMSGLTYSTPFGPTNTVGYSFSYDHSNRLTDAQFGALFPSPSNSWNTQTPYTMPSIGFNTDGNISSLERYGSSTSLTDNLTYNYQSGTHRVTSISNSAGAGSSYTYDDNGNVISDSKDNISFEIYDIYNEPVEVYLGSGTVYTYGYEVNGARILKNWGGSNWNFYMNDPDGKTIAINLEPYSQDEVYNVWAPQTGSSTGNDNIGQVRYTYGPYSYYYYLKDHLGDIKMILNSSGGVDSYNDYYPFGEQMPNRNLTRYSDGRYKYISVEQDAETGLYATGPRLYDPWSGRFGATDPLVELYASESPYSYSFDNPVSYLDPSGLGPDGTSIAAPTYWLQPVIVWALSPKVLTSISDFLGTYSDVEFGIGVAAGGAARVAPMSLKPSLVVASGTGFATSSFAGVTKDVVDLANYGVNHKGSASKPAADLAVTVITTLTGTYVVHKLDETAKATEYGFREASGRFVSKTIGNTVTEAETAVNAALWGVASYLTGVLDSHSQSRSSNGQVSVPVTATPDGSNVVITRK